MSDRRPTVISIFGAGTDCPELLEAARHVGRALAERGATIVTGGLGGVMSAACAGAQAAGGHTVGLLPGPGYDKSDANPYVALALPTGLGQARNTLVAAAGDAAIAVGGSAGTLSEIAIALKVGRPVVTLRTAPIDPDWIPDGARLESVRTPEEAVERALALVTTLR